MDDVRQQMHTALMAAMRGKDSAAVSALRSALAAIANAEAVQVAAPETPVVTSQHVAGAAAGLGAAEVERRVLTSADLAAVIGAEVDERLAAAEGYDRTGRPGQASRLRAEAEVLAPFAPGGGPSRA